MIDRKRILDALAALGQPPAVRETPAPLDGATGAEGPGEASAEAAATARPPTAPTAPPGVASRSPSLDPEALARALGARWEETDHGRTLVREVVFPPGHVHGRLNLGALPDAGDSALSTLLGAVARQPARIERLAFFDTETTGLAGGTGTCAFLAGVGSFREDGAFCVRQWFLASLPEEKAMLDSLGRELDRFDGIVTYNGAAFDMPVIEARRTLQRLPRAATGAPHHDLLHPTRRLFRGRLPNCRLQSAEAALLGFEREDDVPGHLIPSFYFDYLRLGRVGPLHRVLRHNAFDIVSLAGVLVFLARLFRSAEEGRVAAEDAAYLGRWWELEGETARARALYGHAVSGLEAGPAWTAAASRLASLLKRGGARAEALGLWERLFDQGDVEAGLELTKHLEHHERDLARAEQVTQALLERAPRIAHGALSHRLERIRRKLARRAPK